MCQHFTVLLYSTYIAQLSLTAIQGRVRDDHNDQDIGGN